MMSSGGPQNIMCWATFVPRALSLTYVILAFNDQFLIFANPIYRKIFHKASGILMEFIKFCPLNWMIF